MLYAEPFSSYGAETKLADWNGKTKQKEFGSEAEVILQRSTKFRVLKVDYDGDK